MKRNQRDFHPWIFRTEIDRIEGEFDNGDVVNVHLSNGKFYGIGYINTKSKITIRLLSLQPMSIEQIIDQRVAEALKRREALAAGHGAYRLVNSEADGLPGLVVDKYGDYLVMQLNTLGMEKLKSLIVEKLKKYASPLGIYEKSDAAARAKEGLEESCGWLLGSGPEVLYFEQDGLLFAADLRGQKTGAFLDQLHNSRLCSMFAKDRVCLDAFSYTGNFALHLLKAGAQSVVLIDYSQRSLSIAEQLLTLNGFSNYHLVQANAFDWLKENSRFERFELVVLDPPSFAKTSTSKDSALRGHKEINLRAMRILKKPGILATASCTQVISEQEFESILSDAAKDSKVLLSVLYKGGQGFDHPFLLGVPETRYLKFIIAEVRRRY
ncbi:MAG: SAM-dependent methyltransferase [Thermotoga sp. 50_1627]|uniref:class I SAM-dependent rRNA methyltransferase n=1 Tax=Pseudothermotoga sp. TaxID=2033661 RepID=UPI00076D2386|nr:MAG: SAM-dependent methyltransferase [Thermotoga sp. 50_64]KUK25536.1 MAG: SAM-dependent methyltransferase [Thermotoga sp. 50_1627]MDK2922572.1 rRNA (cytosine1962-C5)-methyltransferase [Pseudothermotoga sp.]